MAHTATNTKQAGNKEKGGYPTPLLYPDSEDTCNRFYEEPDIDPVNITRTKEPAKSEKGFRAGNHTTLHHSNQPTKQKKEQ